MRHVPDNALLAAYDIYSRMIAVGKMLGGGVLIAAFWYGIVLLKA
jgi:hypothetical protein